MENIRKNNKMVSIETSFLYPSPSISKLFIRINPQTMILKAKLQTTEKAGVF